MGGRLGSNHFRTEKDKPRWSPGEILRRKKEHGNIAQGRTKDKKVGKKNKLE